MNKIGLAGGTGTSMSIVEYTPDLHIVNPTINKRCIRCGKWKRTKDTATRDAPVFYCGSKCAWASKREREKKKIEREFAFKKAKKAYEDKRLRNFMELMGMEAEIPRVF